MRVIMKFKRFITILSLVTLLHAQVSVTAMNNNNSKSSQQSSTWAQFVTHINKIADSLVKEILSYSKKVVHECPTYFNNDRPLSLHKDSNFFEPIYDKSETKRVCSPEISPSKKALGLLLTFGLLLSSCHSLPLSNTHSDEHLENSSSNQLQTLSLLDGFQVCNDIADNNNVQICCSIFPGFITVCCTKNIRSGKTQECGSFQAVIGNPRCNKCYFNEETRSVACNERCNTHQTQRLVQKSYDRATKNLENLKVGMNSLQGYEKPIFTQVSKKFWGMQNVGSGIKASDSDLNRLPYGKFIKKIAKKYNIELPSIYFVRHKDIHFINPWMSKIKPLFCLLYTCNTMSKKGENLEYSYDRSFTEVALAQRLIVGSEFIAGHELGHALQHTYQNFLDDTARDLRGKKMFFERKIETIEEINNDQKCINFLKTNYPEEYEHYETELRAYSNEKASITNRLQFVEQTQKDSLINNKELEADELSVLATEQIANPFISSLEELPTIDQKDLKAMQILRNSQETEHPEKNMRGAAMINTYKKLVVLKKYLEKK